MPDCDPIRLRLLFESVIDPDRIELAGANFAFSAHRQMLYMRPKGSGWMPFDDIAEHEQLAILLAVLDEICLAAGIKPQSPERRDAAGLLMHLHRIGCHTADELKATFEEVTRQPWRAWALGPGRRGPAAFGLAQHCGKPLWFRNLPFKSNLWTV